MTVDEASALEHLISDLISRDLSPAQERKARLLLLDTIACATGSMGDPVVKGVAERFAGLTPGPSRIHGTDLNTGIPEAAFVTTLAACWFEACEGLASAHGRPGLSVIPAALMVAQARGLTLGKLLTAIALGYEIGGRLGAAYRIRDDMHVDGTWGLAASTAAVTYLLGGDTAAIRNAVNVALCQMPGSLYLPISTGDTVRNTYAAHASAQSIHLAQAALAGVTAPDTTDDEVRRIIMDTDRSTEVNWSVTDRLLLEDAYIKMFAAVRHVHYGVTAALEWRAANGDKATKDITGLSLSIYEEAITYCGVRQPHTAIQAQFSLSYGIAHALVCGSLGPDAYTPEHLIHPEVQRLENLVEITADPAQIKRGADLVVTIEDAAQTYSVTALAGDPEKSLEDSNVTDKAMAYMTPVIGADKAELLIQHVMSADLVGAFLLPKQTGGL